MEAKGLLDGYQRTAKYKINADVVNGLLARAYLNTGQVDTCGRSSRLQH